MQVDLLEGLISGPLRYAGLPTPSGATVWIAADAEAIVRIAPGCNEREFLAELRRLSGLRAERSSDERLLREAARQLDEYLAGRRQRFELPVKLSGSAFQLRVWRVLTRIPYGETRSYGEVAAAAGIPGGARAVGGACRANPVAILVPCHRVVRSDGALGGYGGGLRLKQFLLDLERQVTAAPRPRPTAR